VTAKVASTGTPCSQNTVLQRTSCCTGSRFFRVRHIERPF
jgi:hypothetical protein